MFSKGKLIIFSAPSGAGKTTIVRRMLSLFPKIEFSISATSRPARPAEVQGKDYHFLDPQEFRQRIEAGDFLEWEEVYPGTYYGTLRSEVARIWNEGKHVIFDIDVVGGRNLKEHFGRRALSFFVRVPDMKTLEKRLRGRGTDDEEKILQRLKKAEHEMQFESLFDHILVNDDLEKVCLEAEQSVRQFLEE